MIIDARKDLITIYGNLTENSWLEIKAAANLLSREHPEGIIIDCGSIDTITPDGVETFKEAMHDVQSQGAKLIFANLPQEVHQVVRAVPGARSELPIAQNVEEARAALGVEAMMTEKPTGKRYTVLVPIFKGLESERAIEISCRLGREHRADLHLVYLLDVPRTESLQTPMLEREKEAQEILENGKQIAKKNGLKAVVNLERVRDLADGAARLGKELQADLLVLSIKPPVVSQAERLMETLFSIFQLAPCEVIIDRVPVGA